MISIIDSLSWISLYNSETISDKLPNSLNLRSKMSSDVFIYKTTFIVLFSSRVQLYIIHLNVCIYEFPFGSFWPVDIVMYYCFKSNLVSEKFIDVILNIISMSFTHLRTFGFIILKKY